MKKILLCMAACAALLTGCQNDDDFNAAVKESSKFAATFENNNATRVYLANDYYYRWEAGDQVSVFTENDLNRIYQATKGDVILTDLELQTTPIGEGATLTDYNYAIFPYNESNKVADGVLSGVIASEQTYDVEHPDLNHAVMVSRIPADEKTFTFKNSCALVKVNIKVNEKVTKEVKVSSITITSKENGLAGNVTVDMNDNDYAAKIQAANASKSITLTGCEAAGTLSSSKYTSFYLVIPAGLYKSGDLTIKIETEDNALNYTTVIPKEYTVNRSQYIELNTTLGGDQDWGIREDDKIEIEEDVELTDKALMADVPNLIKQGFINQDKISAIYSIPYEDFTINGNGKTFTFKTTDENVFVMNTFTSYYSGIKQIPFDEVPKITVNNLTITGELRTTMMGIHVNDRYSITPTGATSGQTSDQTKFNTEWNNVKVTDCQIIPCHNVWGGTAVGVFGTAVLNNCVIKGTSLSPKTSEDLKDLPFYDMYVTNNTTVTINGGEIGHINCTEHSNITIEGGVKVNKITSALNGVNAFSTSYKTGMTINNAEINIIELNTTLNNNGGPKATIGSEAKIGTMTIAKEGNYKNISIAEGATVEKIIVAGTEYDLAGFKALQAGN